MKNRVHAFPQRILEPGLMFPVELVEQPASALADLGLEIRLPPPIVMQPPPMECLDGDFPQKERDRQRIAGDRLLVALDAYNDRPQRRQNYLL